MISTLNALLNFTHDVTKHPGPACTGVVGVFDVPAGLSVLAFAPKARGMKWRWAPTRVTACACQITLVPRLSYFSPAALSLYTVLHIKSYAPWLFFMLILFRCLCRLWCGLFVCLFLDGWGSSVYKRTHCLLLCAHTTCEVLCLWLYFAYTEIEGLR